MHRGRLSTPLYIDCYDKWLTTFYFMYCTHWYGLQLYRRTEQYRKTINIELSSVVPVKNRSEQFMREQNVEPMPR